MLSHELEVRVSALANLLPDISQELRFALQYIETDAKSSLTKSRSILETLLLRVYILEMNRAPRKPELGEMLNDNQFTRKIRPTIVTRMHTVRALGNRGA